MTHKHTADAEICSHAEWIAQQMMRLKDVLSFRTSDLDRQHLEQLEHALHHWSVSSHLQKLNALCLAMQVKTVSRLALALDEGRFVYARGG